MKNIMCNTCVQLHVNKIMRSVVGVNAKFELYYYYL